MKKLFVLFLLLGTVIMSVNAQVVMSSGSNGQEYATIKCKNITDSVGIDLCMNVIETYMQQPTEVRPDGGLTTVSKEAIMDTVTRTRKIFYWVRIFDAASNAVYFGGIAEGMSVLKRGDCIILYNIPVKKYQPGINWDDEKINIQRNSGSYNYQVGGKRRVVQKTTPPQKTFKSLAVVQDSSLTEDDSSWYNPFSW